MTGIPEKLVQRKVVRDDGSVPFTKPQTGVAPTDALHLVTKAYVDTLFAGLKWKASVRVATTANGTLATAFENGDTVDGVTLATGDRILLKNQTTASENGIRIVQPSGAPVRATDADVGSELVGATVAVEQGTVNADRVFLCVTNAPITIDSTSLVFTPLAALLGLGALAFLSTVDSNLVIDETGTAGAGSIFYMRSGAGRFSSPPPDVNYAPYWDGSEIQWMAVSP